jgi:predicted amidohydrolase/ribosomal protein S18 acetylase RimI-like enzyme
VAELNLEDFQRSVRVRPLRLEDFDPLVTLHDRCFPGMEGWTRQHIESQLRLFPEGQMVVEYEGRLVASSSSLIVDFALHEAWHDWRRIADNGNIRTHDPNGDTLYGIEMMVDPEFRGLRLSRRLYDERKRLARERNLRRIVIGGRIPGYREHAGSMSAREYVDAVMRKSLHDPVLTAQLANGFVLQRLVPNYLPDDDASQGYATILEWSNWDHVPERKGREYRRIRRVRICVVQYQMRAIPDFAAFSEQVAYFVDVASDHRSDFVVFPESFTNQLLSCQREERPGTAQRSLAELTPQYLDLFRGLAIQHNVNIVGGSMFVVEDDRLYNAAYLFRRDGTLERQLKLHATVSEQKWWGLEPGHSLTAFDTDVAKVAILLSTDVEFPELARHAASEGAEILFVPFSADERSSYLRVRTCALARAIENDLYVATAGSVGNLPFVPNIDVHYAQSGIYTPSDIAFPRDGVAAECEPNVETLVVHDVDLELLRRHRAEGLSESWADPRPELYQLRFKVGDGWKDVDYPT